jgi:hypothetical protein
MSMLLLVWLSKVRFCLVLAIGAHGAGPVMICALDVSGLRQTWLGPDEDSLVSIFRHRVRPRDQFQKMKSE